MRASALQGANVHLLGRPPVEKLTSNHCRRVKKTRTFLKRMDYVLTRLYLYIFKTKDQYFWYRGKKKKERFALASKPSKNTKIYID
jgi:hypothetical protein